MTHLAALVDGDRVRVADGRQAVGDDERGAPLHGEQLVERVLDNPL
jgi:hypothetical protein